MTYRMSLAESDIEVQVAACDCRDDVMLTVTQHEPRYNFEGMVGVVSVGLSRHAALQLSQSLLAALDVVDPD